jgi:hypothetical protein
MTLSYLYTSCELVKRKAKTKLKPEKIKPIVMNSEKIINALDKYDYKYINQKGLIIVKLDYAQQIIIDVTNPDKVIVKDKLVGWNFLTGSIQMNIKNAMVYNFVGLIIFGFLLVANDNNTQVFLPFFLTFIAWVLMWTIFYHVKSESLKQQIISWTK